MNIYILKFIFIKARLIFYRISLSKYLKVPSYGDDSEDYNVSKIPEYLDRFAAFWLLQV